jgi:Eukaryotic membrane protein family
VLFYELVTLNVAINSYSNALLTLLLSNQFVEIKGAVFKKFEKENLFQMSCADMVERFQLSLLLFIIALRNLIELSGSSFSSLPTSFVPIFVVPSLSLLQTIFSPTLIVLLSEMMVDWLKHAFITKFNHIRPAVYGRFIDVLCKDLVTDPASPRGQSQSQQPFVDQSPTVSRRLGFAALPLACLVIRVTFQVLDVLVDHIDEGLPQHRNYGSVGGVGMGQWSIDAILGRALQATIVKVFVTVFVVSIVWAL